MTDQLQRAWNILKPDERPKGMELTATNDQGSWFTGKDRHGWNTPLDNDAAYVFLCHAVEGVAMRMGWKHFEQGGNHWWDKIGGQHINPDRLTAACDALEVERGSDG